MAQDELPAPELAPDAPRTLQEHPPPDDAEQDLRLGH
jgi:hypothetical protein